MKSYFVTLVLCVILVLSIVGCSEKKEITNEKDIQAINTLIANAIKANNDGEVAAWVDLFDKEAIYMLATFAFALFLLAAALFLLLSPSFVLRFLI